MQGNGSAKMFLRIFIAAGFIFSCFATARGQETLNVASPGDSSIGAPSELSALTDLVRDLQAKLQTLNSQMGDLRNEQQRASQEARELRHQLDIVRSQGAPAQAQPLDSYSRPTQESSTGQPAARMAQETVQSQSTEDRVSKLEEDQQVLEGKVNDQYQTKVESGSKYRLRLSGIALLNLYENRGTVDNQDYPGIAESEQSQAPRSSAGSFGGTLRQSQIRLQAFGPDVAGARTSADVNLDFGGGFPDAPNGSWMGLIRMRTATVRFDRIVVVRVDGQPRDRDPAGDEFVPPLRNQTALAEPCRSVDQGQPAAPSRAEFVEQAVTPHQFPGGRRWPELGQRDRWRPWRLHRVGTRCRLGRARRCGLGGLGVLAGRLLRRP